MRTVSLASGSKGNAYLAGDGENMLLVDCGIGPRTLRARLRAVGLGLDALRAVLITHEHDDHVCGLAALQRLKPGLPVYLNLSTADAVCFRCRDVDDSAFRIFENDSDFEIGPFAVRAFPVMHDVADPVGFFVACGGANYFHATDLGEATAAAGRLFAEADLATLESNHHLPLLRASGRPPSLICRIEGSCGHLSNDQAADFAAAFASARLRHLALAHLSRDCNAPHLALETMREALDRAGRKSVDIGVLAQDCPGEWRNA